MCTRTAPDTIPIPTPTRTPTCLQAVGHAVAAAGCRLAAPAGADPAAAVPGRHACQPDRARRKALAAAAVHARLPAVLDAVVARGWLLALAVDAAAAEAVAVSQAATCRQAGWAGAAAAVDCARSTERQQAAGARTQRGIGSRESRLRRTHSAGMSEVGISPHHPSPGRSWCCRCRFGPTPHTRCGSRRSSRSGGRLRRGSGWPQRVEGAAV